MENYRYKTGLIFIGLLIFLTAQIQVQGQYKADHINLNYILSKLTFTSRISKSTEQINEELIKEISECKVDFVLTSKDEKELREAGASDLLIKTIKKNLPEDVASQIKEKRLEEAQALYEKMLGNDPRDYEQQKIALEAAKEFIEKFSEDEDFKLQIQYLNRVLPDLEKKIAEHNRIKAIQGSLPESVTKLPPEKQKTKQDKYFEEAAAIYKRYIDNYRGNFEQKKIALEAAKEFIEKYDNDEDFKPQVDYLKKVIPNLENKLKPYEPHPPSDYYRLDQAYNTENR